MKKLILLLFATLALHDWSQTYSTSTLDFTSRATLVAMWFHDLPQSSTQVYMINDEEHSYEINSVTFYRCGALIDNCLIIFGSEDAATVSGWDAEDGRVEIRPTSNNYRITKVEIFTRDGDGYKIGISDPYNPHPNTLTEHSSSVTWQDAAASTIIIQAKPDYSGTTTYINQIRVTYADGGQAYACDVNRDGKVDPDDANTVAKDWYYYMYDQTYDAIEWTWSDTDSDGNFGGVVDYLCVVQYLIDNNPMGLDVASYAGLGDVNGNGIVDDRDANKILEFAFTPNRDDANFENIANDWVCDDPTMDFNGDGKCNAWDYVIIQMLIKAGYTTPMPDIDINEVNFPDANFRAYVLQNIDTNGDAKLQPGEANRVSAIDVHESGIATLKGIEHFTRLTELDASYNHGLASPDLSQNTVLLALNLEGCDLATLDVSHNTALTQLNCSNCALTTLDLSACTQLDEVRCQYNQLTSLDVSTCTALTFLACNNNRLATLDVSHNTALATLFCSNNQLSELNVQGNGSIVTLACEVNRLTSLDLSHNPQLHTLQFYGNQIGADAMNALIASLPQVPSEAGGHGTMQPYSELPEHNEGNAFSAQNACDALAKNWTSIEYVSAGDPYYVEYAVEINEVNFPDAGFRQWVSSTCDTNQDDWLQAGEMTRTTLPVSGSNIADLTGIEFFPLLQTLSPVNLQLTTIDLSHNPCIRTIFCHHNQLKGTGVDAMIASLPTLPAATGSICGVWDNHDTMGAETNRFTPEQVAAAAAKGWVIKSFEGLQWVNYEGYPHIVFESEVTKAAIVALFDSGHNGELSYDEAAAVTNQTMFQVRQQLKEATLEEFDEFRYFTGVTDLFGAGNPFAYNTTLKSITLPASITSVTASAFRGCTALERADFLAPTITVMNQSFNNCSSLKSFPFDRVTSIGNYAFYNTALGSVTLPASVENIGYMAFYGDSPIDLTLLADDYEVFSGTGTDAGLHLPVVGSTSKLRLNRSYFSQAYSMLQGGDESVTLQPFIKMDEWANEDVTPFSCDVAVELPAGSTIHIVNGLDHTEGAERALTTRMPGTVVPAGTGVMVKLPERNNYESKLWFLNQTTATASGDYNGNLLQPALAEANLNPVEGWTHMRWEVTYETEVPITCWRATDDPIWVQGGSAYVRVAASEWPSVMSGTQYLVDLNSVPGDVDGSGTVDVADVNILVNIMLGKLNAADYPNANVDGQGSIDVGDVNTIINIMLGKQ